MTNLYIDFSTDISENQEYYEKLFNKKFGLEQSTFILPVSEQFYLYLPFPHDQGRLEFLLQVTEINEDVLRLQLMNAHARQDEDDYVWQEFINKHALPYVEDWPLELRELEDYPVEWAGLGDYVLAENIWVKEDGFYAFHNAFNTGKRVASIRKVKDGIPIAEVHQKGE